MRYCWIVAMAAAMTVLNAIKPLAVDDTVYVEYARHIAQHPLDPYGFKLAGGPGANGILAPAGLPYWLAGSMRLVGERPVLWKLCLFPLVLLLAVSLASLSHRFARGLETPLTALVLFSAAFLPAVNLMLDIPALALTLGALCLFLSGCDRGSCALALLAGCVAGLAMQTKYTAFVAPALFLLAGLWQRRVGFAIAAAVIACGMFAGWEMYLASRYGESHFLLALRGRRAPVLEKLRLVTPLIGLLGGTMPGMILLALAGMGASWRMMIVAALAIMAGAASLFLCPPDQAVLIAGNQTGRPLLTMPAFVFGLLGLAVFALMGAVTRRLLTSDARNNTHLPSPPHSGERGRGAGAARAEPPDANPLISSTKELAHDSHATLFLVAWLLLEIAAYFALSPYPAARRVLGVAVIATLLAGRLAAQTARITGRSGPVWLAVGLNATLGLVYFAIDSEFYETERAAAVGTVQTAHKHDVNATIWCEGVGVFEFYGRRLGMKRLEPEGPRPKAGDWFAYVNRRGGRENPAAVPVAGVGRFRLRVDSRWPVVSQYQVGSAPLELRSGPLVEVKLYQCVDQNSKR